MANLDNNCIDNNDSDVRVEQQLRIKIGEAKNLVPRNGSNGSSGLRDCYCVISLDREQIYRTCSTIEKTLNPFFGEEFQFEIPRRFRNLAIYIYDRQERSVNIKDKVIGKVAIKRDDLCKYHNKESWFAIIPVDADSEVQGKIHLDIKLDHCFKPGAQQCSSKVAIRVIDCNDLGVINGCCDPYVVVTLYKGPIRQETKRSKIKKKTVNPHFDETFHFDIPIRGQNHDRNSVRSLNNINNININNNSLELRISVMHDGNGMFGSAFLGEVKIPLSDIDLSGHNAWYLLQPRDTGRTDDRIGTGLGSLRLKIHYTSDYVFSSRFYDPIRKLILISPEIKPISSSTAFLLGELVSNKVDAAQPLVKIFIHYKKMIELIKVLAETEISKVTDVNTIFRGNSLVSKCMDELMKIVGIRYLHQTLRATIEQVLTEHKTCEIDPSRLKDGESLAVNMSNLKAYISSAFRSITNSALRCPQLMCEIFTVLKELAIKYFPESREVCYYVISGFVFLRFFAPAILNPKLFEITDQQIDSQTNRTLTLISKTIQSIGNLVSSKCTNQVIKEEYMINLYKEFLTEQHIESTKVFLELISSSSTLSVPRVNESPVLLKESVMTKRAQGRRRIGFAFRNFKKRYFCLNTQHFFYAKAKNKRPLCRIPINEILAVEKLQEQSFKMKNMFQVVRKDRALYIQASNCVEEKEWIDILTKVCQTNRNRLKEYHPSAFISGQWLCCKSTNENTSGCCPVTVTSLPPDLGVHIDPDREIERIHTIFLQNMDNIEALIELCEKQHLLSQNHRTNSQYNHRMTHFVIDDRHSLWETLKELRQCVIRLEQNHKQYMRSVCVRTIYGSEAAPIGDDNYLLMLAKHCTT